MLDSGPSCMYIFFVMVTILVPMNGEVGSKFSHGGLIMNHKVLLNLLLILVIMSGCEGKTAKPDGIYQSTSYNTGKKVLFDFKENGDVYVEVSHVNVSDKMVDDSFFPFFAEGESKYKWQMEKGGHLVSIYTESNFEVVKLEYTGKYLSWDKTRFTRE